MGRRAHDARRPVQVPAREAFGWESPQGATTATRPPRPRRPRSRARRRRPACARTARAPRPAALLDGVSSQDFDVWFATGLVAGRGRARGPPRSGSRGRRSPRRADALIERGDVADAASVGACICSVCRDSGRGPEAISPLDGRYAPQVADLGDHVSEWALMKRRVPVEVAWLLGARAAVERSPFASSRAVHRRGAGDQGIEARTNHDVKAVEYSLREGAEPDIRRVGPLRADERARQPLVRAPAPRRGVEVWRAGGRRARRRVATLARGLRDVPLLSRTHGQPATPTTLQGVAVFVVRWRRRLDQLDRQEYRGKSKARSGPTARKADPDPDWPGVSRTSSEGLGLTGCR